MSGPRTGLRVAVVTGASRGLGRVIAQTLASEGFRLILNARRPHPLNDLSSELASSGAEVVGVLGDVGDRNVRAALGRAARRAGQLDLLVNNASELGPSPRRPLHGTSEADLRRIWEVNFLAPVSLIAALRPLLRSSHGTVVNISSDAAIGAYEGWGGYGTSKAALDLATRTLARELKNDGIAVIGVDPGDMRTEMQQAAFPGTDISDRPLPEVTVPFWVWLLGEDPIILTGQRFQAQSDRWMVGA